jgi:hypothetical protein
VGTTQAYVDTDAAVQATPLTVLLARDARVDVFDGERLLQTFYLQAGINQIDTRNFPFGNYLVRMRIYEDGVLVRTEEAPFDKGGDWTNSQWQWFVQGGRRNERRSDRFDGESVAMAGVRVPLGRDAALTAGAANLGGHSYGELRLDLRRVLATQEMRASLSGMRGSDGSNGQQHQLSYRRKASWNLTSSACAARPASSRPMHATSWAAPTHSAARYRCAGRRQRLRGLHPAPDLAHRLASA